MACRLASTTKNDPVVCTSTSFTPFPATLPSVEGPPVRMIFDAPQHFTTTASPTQLLHYSTWIKRGSLCCNIIIIAFCQPNNNFRQTTNSCIPPALPPRNQQWEDRSFEVSTRRVHFLAPGHVTPAIRLSLRSVCCSAHLCLYVTLR